LNISGVEDTTEAIWQRVLDVNQKGVWLGMRTAIPAMRRAGGGSIINISSILGTVGLGEEIGLALADGASLGGPPRLRPAHPVRLGTPGSVGPPQVLCGVRARKRDERRTLWKVPVHGGTTRWWTAG